MQDVVCLMDRAAQEWKSKESSRLEKIKRVEDKVMDLKNALFHLQSSFLVNLLAVHKCLKKCMSDHIKFVNSVQMRSLSQKWMDATKKAKEKMIYTEQLHHLQSKLEDFV